MFPERHGGQIEDVQERAQLARVKALTEAGIDHVIFSMANTTDPKAYPLLAEVVRQVG